MHLLPDSTHLGYVHLTVADMPRALAFYQERLGLRLLWQAEDTAGLGAGAAELLRLTEQPGARPARGHTGLYHFALLLPSRADLGAALRHLLQTNTPLSGAADHLVSEALYLADPDGNGIELYRDRPRANWRRVNGRLQMDTLPLDADSLLTAGAARPAQEMLPDGIVLGHMHLHVADLAAALAFYRDLLGLELQTQFGDQAAFLAAGGYHHQVGINTWAGTGAPPPPAGATGLRLWQMCLPDEAALHTLRARLETAGLPLADHADGVLVRDPSQNTLLLST